jgi:hypothetical protein
VAVQNVESTGTGRSSAFIRTDAFATVTEKQLATMNNGVTLLFDLHYMADSHYMLIYLLLSIYF